MMRFCFYMVSVFAFLETFVISLIFISQTLETSADIIFCVSGSI